MAGDDVRFYYDFNSPYAYLAAQRIDGLFPSATWLPIAFGFLLRDIGKTPWSLTDERSAGIAEVERRAHERGLPPLTWNEGWPRDTWSLLPLRAAVVADEHGRIREFSLEAYRLNFAEGRPLNDPDNVFEAARRAGVEPGSVRDGLERGDVKDTVRANTEEARRRGVTGIPTLAVGDELFWGDDRLEEAVAAAS